MNDVASIEGLECPKDCDHAIGYCVVEFKTKQKQEKEMEKELSVVNQKDAEEKVNDIVINGNTDTFQLICKASSKSQGWMKSTKAMQIDNCGVVVQVSTQQGDNVAESICFVPNAEIVVLGDGSKIIDSI